MNLHKISSHKYGLTGWVSVILAACMSITTIRALVDDSIVGIILSLGAGFVLVFLSMFFFSEATKYEMFSDV